MATIQIDAAASSPLREGARPRPKRKSRPCLEWWSILPHTYKFFLILVVLAVLLVGFLFIQSFVKSLASDKDNASGARYVPNPVYDYKLPKSYSTLHLFKSGAVCSDSKICSEIGKKILEESGNVADSAIATLFCNDILQLQSQGIGGGFVMNLFIGGKAYTLNAREVAPIQLKNETFKKPDDYLYGPLSIATPGEIKGYWELHQRFGSMKWKDLILPSIELCERGFELTEHHYDSVLLRGNLTVGDPYLKKMLYNETTNELFKAGTLIRPAQQLCDTLKIIAENGGEDFYSGHLADLIVDDLRDIGSVITKEDLYEYKTTWAESIQVQMDDHTMYITPPPTGGAIVALILNILKGYKFTPESVETEDEKIRTYHRIIESFKFGFGQRSKIGDPMSTRMTELYNNLTSLDFAESLRQQIDDTKTFNDALHYGAQYATTTDHGTAHTAIIAPNGDAISVTASVNTYYGCWRSGRRTGIIFNAGINDFGIPTFQNQYGLSASPANYLKPKKRALTSMSPIIITDENNKVKMAIGAAGGTKIITSVALTIMRTLWFGQNVKEAIDIPRIHHQLEPMTAQYEYGVAQPILDGLEKLGHVTERIKQRGSIVCALYKNETGIYGNADFRKKGDVVGLN